MLVVTGNKKGKLIMMITGITTYTPIREAQKVNFGAVQVVDDRVKKYCGLTYDDISRLNDKCPTELDINVAIADHRGAFGSLLGDIKVLKDGQCMGYTRFPIRENFSKQSNKDDLMEAFNILLNRIKNN